MSKSRYSDTGILEGRYFKTFSLRSRAMGLKLNDLLSGVPTTSYDYKVGDRLDHLAAKFLGDDQYWWIIALVNGINYPFASGGLTPGRTLKIPTNASSILDKIMR